MEDKNIIGHVINVTGMVGVSAGIVLFTFGIVLLLFRRGLASIFQIRFTGSGSWRVGPLRASAMRGTASNSEDPTDISSAFERTRFSVLA